jgi:hypothetical protein
MSLLKQVNKGPHMNSLEQFYIQLYAHNKKLVPEQNPWRIQPRIPFCLQPSESSLYHKTLTYINPRSHTVKLVHLLLLLLLLLLIQARQPHPL